MEGAVEAVELHYLTLFLAMAGMVGLLAGAVLIVRPDWLARTGGYANRWFSTRKLDSALERTFSLDKWFYQHHRASGLLLLAGACWMLVYLTAVFDKFRMLAALVKVTGIPRKLMEGLLDGGVLLSVAGAVFAAMLSLFLLLRPSLLREFEYGANRWISTRNAQEVLEVSREWPDRYVLQYGRAFGLLLLLGSVFMLGMLAFWYG